MTSPSPSRCPLAAIALLVLGHAAPISAHAAPGLGGAPPSLAPRAPQPETTPVVSPAPTSSRAQETAQGSTLSPAELDDLAARVAGELRCPVCRNQAVVESSAELSREMQALIRERLAAGDTPEQVKEYFVARYGEWILLKPEARGVNLLVYVLPALTFLIGGLVVWRLLRRWSRGSEARLSTATAGDAPDRTRPLPTETAGPDTPASKVTGLSERDEEWLEKAVSQG